MTTTHHRRHRAELLTTIGAIGSVLSLIVLFGRFSVQGIVLFGAAGSAGVIGASLYTRTREPVVASVLGTLTPMLFLPEWSHDGIYIVGLCISGCIAALYIGASRTKPVIPYLMGLLTGTVALGGLIFL
jgi:hypothetical protein